MLNPTILALAFAGSIAISPQAGRTWNNPGGDSAFMTCAHRGGQAMASAGRPAEAIADRVVRICTPLLEASLATRRQATARQRAAIAIQRQQTLRTMHSVAVRSVNRTRGII